MGRKSRNRIRNRRLSYLNEISLTQGGGYNLSASLSPDGRYLAWINRSKGIMLANFDAEAFAKQLANPENEEDFDILKRIPNFS
ncbi:MAG: hypothetical protein R2865_09380 [Deinococcales bacterium]